MGQLSEHISMKEYACRCCGALPPNFDKELLYDTLFNIFEDIRRRWGKPIVITSGYRCPDHPESKREPHSAHIFGLALDLQCGSAAEAKRMFNLIDGYYPSLRIGYARYQKQKKNIIHIDIAFEIEPQFRLEHKKRARW